MDDTCTMVAPSNPIDDDLCDAYELIQKKLLKSENIDEFMEIITSCLMLETNFIAFDNILYIIDDKYSRNKNLKGISGRVLLESEINTLDQFVDYPSDSLIDFFCIKFGWDEGSKEQKAIMENYYKIIHIYKGCYYLRQHIYECSKIYQQFMATIRS